MMICSIPAATASSTPYWMIGLSTSGSISLGCALVAGRKRVPQPAAGKTALRTRIEPRWVGVRGRGVGRPSLAPGPSRAGRRPVAGRVDRLREALDEATDGEAEGLRSVQVREVRGAAQSHPPGVAGRPREASRAARRKSRSTRR